MEAMSILGPDERCVRAKLQLFLRLWVARQKYEQLRPFGATRAERLSFHFAHLGVAWCKIVQFQKVMGLEVIPFCPREHFETIYIVGGYVTRELHDATGFLLASAAKWRAYLNELKRLSRGMNPFEFAEICLRCSNLVNELERMRTEPEQPPIEQSEPIPMTFGERLVMAEPV